MATESGRTLAFPEAFLDLRSISEPGLTLGDIFDILRRRRTIVFIVLAGFLFLVTLYAMVATRRYQATGQIQIQKESGGRLA
jgi:succinoglycan biosynthesis transport protein ExoP